MKFKAFLTPSGSTLLQTRFLPALETLSKTCHVCLTPHHTFFLHNLLPPLSGVQSIADFKTPALFSEHHISSHASDCIAFSLDLALLLRALRSASSISTTANQDDDHVLQLKLVKKLPPNSTVPMPFLTLETKGHAAAVIQDIPISKPLSRNEISELQAALDDAQDLPKVLVGVSDLERLLGFVERMKLLGDVMEVSIGRGGDLGLKVKSSLVTLGAEFKRLKVVGEESGEEEEQEMKVLVSMKHFAKCLQYHLAKPDCAYYGVGARGGSLTVIFQFFVPGTGQMDKSVSLHCRLPVIDPGA